MPQGRLVLNWGSVTKVGQKWVAKGPGPNQKFLGYHPTEEAARAKLAEYKAKHPEEFGMIVKGK